MKYAYSIPFVLGFSFGYSIQVSGQCLNPAKSGPPPPPDFRPISLCETVSMSTLLETVVLLQRSQLKKLVALTLLYRVSREYTLPVHILLPFSRQQRGWRVLEFRK